MSEERHDEHHGPPIPTEADALQGRKILIVLGGAMVVALVFSFIAWLVLRGFESDARPGRHFGERDIHPPEVVNGIEQTLIQSIDVAGEVKEQQRRVLESYGWVDRERGIVRIPIERAIDIAAGEQK